MLVPSVLRNRIVEKCRSLRVAIVIKPTRDPPKRLPHLARTPAERQRRRRSYEQRLAERKLRPGSAVHIQFATNDTSLRQLLSTAPLSTVGANM